MNPINKNLLAEVSKPPISGKIEKQLDGYFQEWNLARAQVQKSLASLPGENQELFGLQMLMNSLEFKTQLAAKAGEAVGNTVRRAQSMGSG